jgi:hypothetical protein
MVLKHPRILIGVHMLFREFRGNWRRAGVASRMTIACRGFSPLVPHIDQNPPKFSVDLVALVWMLDEDYLDGELAKAGRWSTAAYCFAVFALLQRDLPNYTYEDSMTVVAPSLFSLFDVMDTNPRKIAWTEADYLAMNKADLITKSLIKSMQAGRAVKSKLVCDLLVKLQG